MGFCSLQGLGGERSGVRKLRRLDRWCQATSEEVPGDWLITASIPEMGQKGVFWTVSPSRKEVPLGLWLGLFS